MAIRYPAIFIGGPPNSGKSWLVWNLIRALRQQKISCYVLRAHPDGEGNWRYEAPPPIADELRRLSKQGWSDAFAQLITRDIARRHLPLLVDAGGQLSPENRQIMTSCTGAILIASDPKALDPWRTEVQQLNLPLLADLHSTRGGETHITSMGVTLAGSISGLGRDSHAHGPCFDELIRRLAGWFQFENGELYRHHSTMIDTVPLHLEEPIGDLPAHSSAQQLWEPHEIPALLHAVDRNEPQALYGAAPIWVYAALAAHTVAPPILFNVALGWIDPPGLVVGGPMDAPRLHWELRNGDGWTQIQYTLGAPYLDYEDVCANPLAIPNTDLTRGVILDGKLPIWLYAALARAYAGAQWVAIRETRSDPPSAIVVAAQQATLIGTRQHFMK